VPPQPTLTSCGPTCLHAVYAFHDLHVSIDELIETIPPVESGGTLAVLLGLDALRRGFRVELYTCNLRIFDPTWFPADAPTMMDHLRKRQKVVTSKRQAAAIQSYMEYVEAGGQLYYEDLSRALLVNILERGLPVLTGLSATALYREPREIPETNKPDPIRGEPVGHFVVLSGMDERKENVCVGDPFDPNPVAPDRHYIMPFDRLVHSILLGVLTYDGNLLIISKLEESHG
jgi:hypothetical protein